MFLPNQTKHNSVSSTGEAGSSFLAAQFYNVLTDKVSYNNIASPGNFSGTVKGKISNWMQGAELNGLLDFACDCNWNVTGLVGFRYWNFVENLKLFTSSPYLEIQDVHQTVDKFDVQNNFYGGQVGIAVDWSRNCFFVNAKAKVALGAMCEELNIQGSLFTNDYTLFRDAPPTVQEFSGGYFALPTNIGHHNQTNFAVIPEVNINLGYNITDTFRFKVGYTFLYVSNMLWSGNQIDTNINPTQAVSYTFDPPNTKLVGQASPKALLKTSDFWVQGVSIGFDFEF